MWVRMPLRLCVLDTTLCDKVYQWLPTGRWFSPGTPVSSINKTDRHDITAILLKVALYNTIHPWRLFQKPTVCTKWNIYDFIIGRQIELESRRLMFDGHLNRWTVNYGQYFQSFKEIKRSMFTQLLITICIASDIFLCLSAKKTAKRLTVNIM